jgi:hypothetical protein
MMQNDPNQFPPPPPLPYAMSQDPGAFAAQAPMSAYAIAALVVGLLFCVPLAGFAAVLLGVIGLAHTQGQLRRGRGLAVAGLLLGLLGIVWTIAAAGMGLKAYHVAREFSGRVDGATHSFLTAVGNNDFATARNLAALTIDDAQLHAILAQHGSDGPFVSMTKQSFNVANSNGDLRIDLTVVAKFQRASHQVVFVLHRSADGALRVTQFSFSD